ncbi:enkurin isoform X2 [Diabrotica undecimpunctata]
MSVILITKHNENIYNIYKAPSEPKKQPFKSKFREITEDKRLQVQSHIQQKEHATMGVPEVEPPDPHNYLKKRTGKPCYLGKEVIKREKVKLKMDVPKLSECLKAYKPAKPSKNFIVENVKTVHQMKPKEPIPTVVIDRQGNKQPLKAGLEPIYIKIPPFGKTPTYLKRFIDQKEKEYQMKKDASGVEQPLCKYITRDQREALLSGLKQNWEELQQQYQGLPILTDTIPKILRKSKMEADLKQLEKDIVLLERHPYIYVYEDDEIQ